MANIPLTDLLSGGTNSLRTEVTNIPTVTNANIDIALSALRDAITKTGETVKTLADVVDKLSDVGVTSLPSLIAGSDIVGKFGIDQTTGGTTNGIVNKNASGNEIFTDASPGSMKLTGSNAVEGIADFQLNIQGVLLASGARNVSTSCAKQINKNARGLMIFVNVTAVSGSGGLLLKVRGYDPVSGAAGHINNDPVAITATGLYAFAYYPGATGAGTILKQSTSAPLPKEWDAYVYHQDGSSYTYSIGYTAIL